MCQRRARLLTFATPRADTRHAASAVWSGGLDCRRRSVIGIVGCNRLPVGQTRRQTRMPVHEHKLEIVPYDPRWPGEFEAEAIRLRTALGSLALRIDHNGSTSVPGLGAKPIIDIQVSVAA